MIKKVTVTGAPKKLRFTDRRDRRMSRKLSIGVVKFHNYGVVQSAIGLFP